MESIWHQPLLPSQPRPRIPGEDPGGRVSWERGWKYPSMPAPTTTLRAATSPVQHPGGGGLRGRALARKQMKLIDGAGEGRGRPFRPAHHGLHGGTISYDGRANWLAPSSPARSAASSARAGWRARLGGRTSSAPTSAAPPSTWASSPGRIRHQASTPDIACTLLAIPWWRPTVGSGTGSLIRINPSSNRIEIGPDSAGYRIGCCWPEGGVTVPTITDCNGAGPAQPRLLPGRRHQADKEIAFNTVKEQIADPLKIDVCEAAAWEWWSLRGNPQERSAGAHPRKGYASVHNSSSYGEGGPARGRASPRASTPRAIPIPTWAAGFSAFGCACSNLSTATTLSIDLADPARACPSRSSME